MIRGYVPEIIIPTAVGIPRRLRCGGCQRSVLSWPLISAIGNFPRESLSHSVPRS